jgi:pyridoxamine 5'-phosphate oxidase
MSAIPTVNFEEALAFANRNQACWVATSQDDQPHVRGMLMWFADASGFYFHTGAVKPLAEQIAKNPRVEIAFHNPGKGPGDGRMLRVTGKVERVVDAALEARLVSERAWLKDMVAASAKGLLVIFRMPHGEIRDWTMAVNTHERDVVPLLF